MKKNYICGLCKVYGIIPTIVLALGLVLISYATVNPLVSTVDGLTNVLTGGLYALFIGFAVIGLSDLKSSKVNFLDFIRVSGLLASGGVTAILALNDASLPMIITYASVAGVLLIEVIVRFVFGRYEGEKIGFKSYVCSLSNSFNPVLLAVIAIAASVVGYIYLDKLNGFFSYLGNYGTGIAIAMVFIVLVISSCKKNTKASILDALFVLVFYISLISLVFYMDKLDFATFKIIGLFCIASVLSLIYRAASFEMKDMKSSKLKINRYYADLYSKYDVSISILVAFILVSIFMITTYNVTSFNNILISVGFNAIDFTNMVDIIKYVVAGVCVLFILLFVIVRKGKNKEIKAVDKITNILGYIALFSIPYIVILALDFKANLEILLDSIPLLVVVIAFLLVLIVSFILQVIRYAFYKGEVLENTENQEAEVLESQEEAVNEQTQEEPAQEETIVYVDEDGNEIDPTTIDEETQVVVEENQEAEVLEEVVEETEEPAQEETIVYVDEDGNEIDASTINEETQVVVEENQEESLEDEVEEETEDDEDLEEEEIEEDEESLEPTQAKEKDILMPEVQIVDENGAPKKIKRKFNTRMMFAPYEAKEYYNEIKNYLIMYRAKGRYSSRCETFRYRGLVAKVALAGKSIKVCLAIDPQSLAGTKYHFKDVSEKKQYAEVPTMIKVRSPRGLKYFKELVDIMMAARAVKPKRNYQPTNFMPSLIPNGEAILATIGMSTDYLYPTMNVRGIPAEMPDDLADYLPVIQGEELNEEEVEATIYLDTLCNHFIDGDEITIDVLKTLHIVNKGNVLRIKARGTLDRKLIIYAEYFDSDALKMLMCTNCTVVKIVR